MKRLVGLMVAAILLVAMPAVAEVVAPPVINMPTGGKVVTEINLSDNDVLGIIKQSIPAVADVLKELAPAFAQRAGAPDNLDFAKMINLDEFSQAISGVKDVRVLIARYPKTMTPQRFLAEFTAGVAKTGRFNKTVSDSGFFPGSVGMFSAPDNGGIIGFAYNPQEHTAYMIRVVGGLDMPKLIRWSGQIAKMFVGARTGIEEKTPAQVPSEPSPETAKPQPATEGQ